MNADTEAVASHRGTGSRIVIRAGSKRPLLDLRELWAYREVLHALVLREIKIRYAQTVVGIGWAVLQPVLTTVVLSLLAGRWMGVPTDGLPYPLFAYSGLAAWIYFTHVLTKSSVCLLSTGLISKAYFPRLLLPLASAIGGLIDLGVASAILAALMVYYKASPGWGILLLPVCALILMTTAFGIGTWLAVLNLYHRDVVHALPFATQLLFFMTPVAYATKLVPPSWRAIYCLNPMLGVIECFRWSLFGRKPEISFWEIGASLATGAIVTLGGLAYFRRNEPTLADAGDI